MLNGVVEFLKKYTVFYGVGGDLALEYLIDTSKNSANNKITLIYLLMLQQKVNMILMIMLNGILKLNQDYISKYLQKQKEVIKKLKYIQTSISSLSTGIKYKDFKAVFLELMEKD